MAILQVFWIVGSVACVSLSWLFLRNDADGGWRSLVVSCSIPIFISAGALCWVPESPRWLLEQGRTDEVTDMIMMIARFNGLPPPMCQFRAKRIDVLACPEKRINCLSDIQVLFDQKHVNTTTAILIIWAMMGFSFYGTTLLLTRVSINDSSECTFDFSFLAAIYSTEILGAAALLMTIDHLGRKTSCMIFFSIGALSVIVLGFATEWDIISLKVG